MIKSEILSFLTSAQLHLVAGATDLFGVDLEDNFHAWGILERSRLNLKYDVTEKNQSGYESK